MTVPVLVFKGSLNYIQLVNTYSIHQKDGDLNLHRHILNLKKEKLRCVMPKGMQRK